MWWWSWCCNLASLARQHHCSFPPPARWGSLDLNKLLLSSPLLLLCQLFVPGGTKRPGAHNNSSVWARMDLKIPERCNKKVPDRMSECISGRMQEWMPDRMSLGGDYSKNIIHCSKRLFNQWLTGGVWALELALWKCQSRFAGIWLDTLTHANKTDNFSSNMLIPWLGPRLCSRKPTRLCTRETNSVVHADAGVLMMVMTVMTMTMMMMIIMAMIMMMVLTLMMVMKTIAI